MPIPGKKTLKFRELAKDSIALVELTDTMYAVVVADANKNIVASRNFAFTEDCKKEVMKSCRAYYRLACDCVTKQKIDILLEDTD